MKIVGFGVAECGGLMDRIRNPPKSFKFLFHFFFQHFDLLKNLFALLVNKFFYFFEGEHSNLFRGMRMASMSKFR